MGEDLKRLLDAQYYGTWSGYGISSPKGVLDLKHVPGVSILADRRPELSGLKNVDYTNDQLIKMGEDWKKDQLGAFSGIPWGTIAAVAANNVAGFINGFGPDYSASDLSASAGTGTNSRMGISYTT